MPSRNFVSWYTVLTHKTLRHRFETFCKLVNLGDLQNLYPEHSEGLRHRETFCDCWPVPDVFTLKGSKGGRERVSGRVSKARQMGFRGIVIQVACAFETFCGLVMLDNP